MAYLGFGRDRLYKLTSAHAIPCRKKRRGQGLLFRRDELDRWIEAEYESTGCSPHVELWSTTTSKKCPGDAANVPGPGNGGEAPMQAKRNATPRRRPVSRHPGIYYRPKPDGKVGPPYEIRYLDSGGVRRWALCTAALEDAEAKRADLLLRRRAGERIEPTRQSFEEYAARLARPPNHPPPHPREVPVGARTAPDPAARPPPPRPDHRRGCRPPHHRPAPQRAAGLDDHDRAAAALDHPRPGRPPRPHRRQPPHPARTRRTAKPRRPTPQTDPQPRGNAGADRARRHRPLPLPARTPAHGGPRASAKRSASPSPTSTGQAR